VQDEGPDPHRGEDVRRAGPEKESSVSRRRFIAASAAGAIGLGLAGAAFWPIWEYLSPQSAEGEKVQVTIPRSQLGIGQAHFFQYRGRPAVVFQVKPGEFIALSAICTHLGCIVNWRPEEQIFLCPCHAGKFSLTGEVLAGPPPRSLPPYPVTVKGNEIVIG